MKIIKLLYLPFFSFLASWLIVGDSDSPSLGFALAAIGLATLIYKYQKNRTKHDHLAYGFLLLFSMFLGIRSGGFENFVTFMGIAFLGSLLINRPWGNETLDELIFAPFKALLRSWQQKPDSKLSLVDHAGSAQPDIKKDGIIGIILAVLIAAVTMPLLASANPIFSGYLDQLRKLMPDFEFRTDIYIGRLLITVFLIFFIPKFLTLSKNFSQKKLTEGQLKFNLIPAKLVLAVILGVFMVSQIQLYTASDQIYQELGITHSERTREVFGQLSVVALIVLSLLYFESKKSKLNSRLNLILGAESMLLLIFALQSDLAYINQFGFTQARLYGLFFLGLVAALFTSLIYLKNTGWAASRFLNSAIWIVSGTVLLLNIINVDYFVFHFNPAKVTGKQIDIDYMTRLSPDSLAYDDLYNFYTLPEVTRNSEQFLGYKIDRLKEKFSDLDWRAFSFYEWLAYQEVKDLDTTKLYQHSGFEAPIN